MPDDPSPLLQFASDHPTEFSRVTASSWQVEVELAEGREPSVWTLSAFDADDARAQAEATWRSETGAQGHFRIVGVGLA